MQFNPQALMVAFTFVLVLAAAVSGSTLGVVAVAAAVAVELLMWTGAFGYLRRVRR